MNELKPCPFCGGTDFVQAYVPGIKNGNIRLHNICSCGASNWNGWDNQYDKGEII